MTSDRSRLGLILLLSPLLIWLVTLIILPHIGMFAVSLREKVGVREFETGFANYAVFFNEPLYWNTFARTAYMSIVATALTLLIGFPIAYYIAKLTRGRTKTTLFLMCLIPFWVSELVRTFGWMILLREFVIPHAMPGIVSGCIVVFMPSLGNYLTAILLGGKDSLKDSLWFTGMIYTQFITRFNWELGSAFGFLLPGLSSLVVYLGLRLSGQTLSDTMGPA